MGAGKDRSASQSDSIGLTILGVDFTSAPRPAKPIVVAHAVQSAGRVEVVRIEAVESLERFEALLDRPGPWVGGFDFPFGLPRELVAAMGWPLDWPTLMTHYRSLDRREINARFLDFRAMRKTGSKYAHRAGDAASGAHPSMKLVNPRRALEADACAFGSARIPARRPRKRRACARTAGRSAGVDRASGTVGRVG